MEMKHFFCIQTVIPKQHLAPTTQLETEQNTIIPQWAIAVIVIGAGSLLFVVIFGAAVVSQILNGLRENWCFDS